MGIEERYKEVRQLVSIGKEKGYLVYDEINDLLPEEVSCSQEDLEEIFAILSKLGIELVDSADAAKKRERDRTVTAAREQGGKFELHSRELDKTNDPVRMYLREMGTVPLLTREGEVEIARRIERGQKNVVKALSRCRYATRRILLLGDTIRKKERRIESIITVSEDELDQNRAGVRLKTLSKINRTQASQKTRWRSGSS